VFGFFADMPHKRNVATSGMTSLHISDK